MSLNLVVAVVDSMGKGQRGSDDESTSLMFESLGKKAGNDPKGVQPQKEGRQGSAKHWRLLSMSPALGLRLDCAVRGTRCEKSQFESLEN